MKSRNYCQALTFVFVFFTINSAIAQPGQNSMDIPGLIEQYYADKGSLDRTYQLKQAPEYFERMDRFYSEWLEQLDEMDYEAFSVSEAVDFLLLRRNIRGDYRDMEQKAADYQEVAPLLTFADIIREFEQDRRIGRDINGQELAEELNRLSAQVRALQDSLKESEPLDPGRSRLVEESAEELHDVLKDSYEFYDGYDPDVTWWAKEAYGEADTTLTAYVSFLEERAVHNRFEGDESGIAGAPVGREELLNLLEEAMIPYSPEELIEIAENEYEWSLQQMLEASRELGFGDDWKEALEHVKNTYVDPGKQPEMIYDLAIEATDFMEERELLTIPELAKETWRMQMMSPQRQRINPFFLGGEVIQISYPTNTMTREEKMMSMRGNNPHFSKATVHHELIPGHHLQGFYRDRYHQYRDPFWTPFWTEGWALYWELRLWEMEFPESPEDQIGMLYWRMHRCARIIFSLSFHLGEMSPQEAIDFIVDKVGHEYKNAEAEVRRSFEAGYPPLYQAAYMLGGLQILAMHRELVEEGDMPEKEFHDTILIEGNMPIEMMRYLLREEKPEKDFETGWRFYD